MAAVEIVRSLIARLTIRAWKELLIKMLLLKTHLFGKQTIVSVC